jgi:hypothetical protein
MAGPMSRFGSVGFLLFSTFGLFLGCGGNEAPGAPGAEGAITPLNSDAAQAAVVTGLAHEFMEALSTQDTATLTRLLAPQAMLYSVREGETGPVLGVRTRESFLEGIGGDARGLLERIWDPWVEVSGRVGIVWAPYDFHLNGEFSHCGIDVLTFLKLQEGWKVTSITYNVVREDCPESPLGVPGG